VKFNVELENPEEEEKAEEEYKDVELGSFPI